MKLKLLKYLRCLDCLSTLDLKDMGAATADSGDRPEDVMEGRLVCSQCSATYTVSGGVPRMYTSSSPDATRPRTAASFGYLWSQSIPGAEMYDPSSYHFQKMARSLSFDIPSGLVLDAGCGDGVDLANQAQRDGVEAIGVDMSEGGCRVSYARTKGQASAHVVQADLCRLPFAAGTFDLAYSYGVLHHLGAPELGLEEVARVAKSGAPIVAYLYEDFSERSALLRWSLAIANTARALTTRLPHWLLYNLCRLASPVVFTVFTLPAMLGRRYPKLARLSENLPFRHGTGPFSLVGDLYDRFSAPVEYRYSRESSAAFFAGAGLQQVRVAAERGWMVMGIKPKRHTEDSR